MLTRSVRLALTALIMVFADYVSANDISLFLENFEKPEKHTALSGKIDSLTIIRGNAEFHLGAGELTLFDFGWDRPSAMVFAGPVRFIYKPPDDIERYQLHKFTGMDTLDCEFDTISFFFTVELDNFPDTSRFIRKKADRNVRWKLSQARDDAFDYLKNNLTAALVGDLLLDAPGAYFYADFNISRFEHLVFREDPYADDLFRIYRFWRDHRGKQYDVCSGFTPDGTLVARRGIAPVDITRYELDTKIERSGKMEISCRIYYNALLNNAKFLYFYWYEKNEPKHVIDSDGDTLRIINRKDEIGLGIVLNKPLEKDQEDYIDIYYESKALKNIAGTFFFEGQTYWYPTNIIREKATYRLTYEYPRDFTLISCGDKIEHDKRNNHNYAVWILDDPVLYVSFNIGLFDTMEFPVQSLSPVTVYFSKDLRRHESLEQTGQDIAGSLSFLNSLLGPCPFSDIKVTEIPYSHGQGSPGLVHLAQISLAADISVAKGTFEMLRGHEIAHQWWGHIAYFDHYRDVWITEGLANYCGFLYYMMTFGDAEACENILQNWRKDIFEGAESNIEYIMATSYKDSRSYFYSVGSKAGPVVLGHRLNSSKSMDYNVMIYEKSAYIFHMLRYLMHDYNTDSDEGFIAFLRDLLERFKNEPITTEALRVVLEEHVQTDMTWFFDQWVYGIHIPEYTFAYDTQQDAEGNYLVTCNVKQKNVPDDFKMIIPVAIHFADGKAIYEKLHIDKAEQTISLPLMSEEPLKIIFNPDNVVLCKVKGD